MILLVEPDTLPAHYKLWICDFGFSPGARRTNMAGLQAQKALAGGPLVDYLSPLLFFVLVFPRGHTDDGSGMVHTRTP